MRLTLNITHSNNNIIVLPLSNGTYDIDWGDDQIDYNLIVDSNNNADHTYNATGITESKVIIITSVGIVPSYSFGSFPTPTTGINLISEVNAWDNNIVSLRGAFNGATLLTSVPVLIPPSVTDMSYMFNGTINFNQDITYWNTKNVTNMAGMFSGSTSFNRYIGCWDTAKVTNMSEMFNDATTFNKCIGSWSVCNVTDMSKMFNNASAFNKYIACWDTSKVTNMSKMFSGATSLNQNIVNWNTSSVTNMSYMFNNAISFDQYIGNWITFNVTDMSHMFNGAKLFNRFIANWDTSNVTNMSYMFNNTKTFDQNIENWDTSNVTNMSYMFNDAKSFDQNVAKLNTSSVTNMSYMFNGASVFNQSVGKWNISNVTNMSGMFIACDLSILTYTNILKDWGSVNRINKSYVTLNVSQKYLKTATAAIKRLKVVFHWTINDFGISFGKTKIKAGLFSTNHNIVRKILPLNKRNTCENPKYQNKRNTCENPKYQNKRNTCENPKYQNKRNTARKRLPHINYNITDPCINQLCGIDNANIMMPNGTEIFIKDIKTGDSVISNILRGTVNVIKRVIKFHYSGYVYKLQSGLICTKDCPVWCNNSKNRIPAHKVTGAVKIYVDKELYNIQFECDGSLYANKLKIDSLSPNNIYFKLPTELHTKKNIFIKPKLLNSIKSMSMIDTYENDTTLLKKMLPKSKNTKRKT